MECEPIANLISARIDGELAASDDAALDAHLAGCAACRAALDAAVVQDAALVRAFAGGRDAAADIAARVAREATAPSSSPSPRRALRSPWWVATAAAACIVLALFARPSRPPAIEHPTASAPPPAAADPIAHLSLASGEVFACPSGEASWKPIAPGEGVEPGAKIRTADAAKCELAMPDGSRLRLNAATELHLAAAQDVRLAGGQIFSAPAPNAAPLRIAAGSANVTAAAPAARLDVAHVTGGDDATVTVVAGAAEVHAPGRATTVRGGQFLRVATTSTGDTLPHVGCEPLADPLTATRWLDDLLLLLPADNDELLARVDLLLSRIVAERAARARDTAISGTTAAAAAAAPTPGPVERDLRARGHAWAPALARRAAQHLAGSAEDDRAKRRLAASLLADLAPPTCVGELIPLLANDDPELRYHTAAALNRLTGQTLGYPPDACAAAPRDPAPLAAWQQWWSRHRERYPPR